MLKIMFGKSNKAIIALASSAVVVLVAGCGPREKKVVVVPPPAADKTAREGNPKTIIVKPSPKPAAKPAPKTKTETNVTVEVKPTPKPAPAQTLPEPAPDAAPKKKEPSSTPATKPTESPKPKAPPVTTAQSKAKPQAKKPNESKSATSKSLSVRAEVISTSKVPDPKSVPYKNALVFTKYKVLEVKGGEYNQKEVLVAQWAMKDKKLQPAARLKVGDTQTLSLEQLSKRPDLESVMRSDDTEEVELEPYFAE